MKFTTSNGNKYTLKYEVSLYAGTYNLAAVAEDYEKFIKKQLNADDNREIQELVIEAMRMLLVGNRDLISVKKKDKK